MKQLPKYAILTSTDLPGVKIISLEHPYIIASVFDYKRDDERVAERLEDMAQERFPIAKIPGYTIFFTMYSSLEPTSNRELQQATLNEMAKFFYEQRVLVKPGVYMKCEESGAVERKIVSTGRIMRERKNRTKKED